MACGCSLLERVTPSIRPPVEAAPQAPDEAAVADIAEQLRAEGEIRAAAQAYKQLAERVDDTESQQHYLLTSAEILADAREYALTRDTLAQLSEPLESEGLVQRRTLLNAQLQIATGDASGALAMLPDESLILTPIVLKRYHAVRANAATMAGRPGDALASLVNLDILERGSNRNVRNVQIWDLLSELDTLTLDQLREAYYEDLPRGWLELTLDIDEVRAKRAKLLPTVRAWRARYPGHPANALLVAYQDSETRFRVDAYTTHSIDLSDLNKVALLLPFTERLRSFSSAIRDGAITSLLESQSNVTLEVFDVGDAASGSLGAYQRAVMAGADLVIGPLRRDAALTLATSAKLDVPVLSLNYLNNGNSVYNLIQFGLSPEDDARNAADFIIGNGLYDVAVIHPATDSGARSLRAFSERLFEWGGRVVTSTELLPDATDFRRQLNELLLIDKSLARRRQLESALDTKLTFETASRADIEALFVPVSPALGRLLKPQLDFHGVGNIPAIATSSVYAGRPRAEVDSDLNQVYFNDIPWLLMHSESESEARTSAQSLGVDEGPLARFFALGHDALTLALNLAALHDGQIEQISGYTGQLSVDNGRIMRKMPFAQFTRGLPERVEFTYPGEPEPALGALLRESLDEYDTDRAADTDNPTPSSTVE